MNFFSFLDHPFQPCLKDLKKDVIGKLNARLAGDKIAVRHIYESFGIKGRFHQSMNMFEFFPDTPVQLFKEVLEVLQLYDLVDLLSEKPQEPQPVRSLRPALPLQEVKKRRESTDPRPTTYHSNVAVLIIAYDKNSIIEGMERFFKGFSSKSDVTVFEWKTRANLLISRYHARRLRTSGLGLEGLDETELRRKEQEAQKEMETDETAVSAVIERWIHNQGW